jgi:hypothetical protein
MDPTDSTEERLPSGSGASTESSATSSSTLAGRRGDLIVALPATAGQREGGP